MGKSRQPESVLAQCRGSENLPHLWSGIEKLHLEANSRLQAWVEASLVKNRNSVLSKLVQDVPGELTGLGRTRHKSLLWVSKPRAPPGLSRKMSSPKAIKWWYVPWLMAFLRWGSREGGLQICIRTGPSGTRMVHLLTTIVCLALYQALYHLLSWTFPTTPFYSISLTWAGQPSNLALFSRQNSTLITCLKSHRLAKIHSLELTAFPSQCVNTPLHTRLYTLHNIVQWKGLWNGSLVTWVLIWSPPFWLWDSWSNYIPRTVFGTYIVDGE